MQKQQKIWCLERSMQTACGAEDWSVYYSLRDKRDALVDELHTEGIMSVDYNPDI